jgi:argininosuccinate lyase
LKLWGGRFRKDTAAELERLGRSLDFDRRLAREEIQANRAYARALQRLGRLSQEECRQLEAALGELALELSSEPPPFLPTDEDIHTVVERLLAAKVGALAEKLPVGRSRNDLAVTGFRLYLASAVAALREEVRELQKVLLERAEPSLSLLMPGYTHLRRGQPVVFGQYLLAYFWALDRDRERLAAVRSRVLALPLGAGAIAGNSVGVDRAAISADLGFESILENSIDAVSARDFAAEFLAAASLLAVDLSRMAEDLILWSSPEFGFISIDEAYSTGSSLMPQKRNPDGLELIRGKCGRVVGSLVALLTTTKGLPTGYQRDLQEDKEPVFDAIDTLGLTLPVMRGIIATLSTHPEAMERALSSDLLATDLADYLVDMGLGFRAAHRTVGEILAFAAEKDRDPASLDLETLRNFSPLFAEDVGTVWDYRASLARKTSRGGVAPQALAEQLDRARRALAQP